MPPYARPLYVGRVCGCCCAGARGRYHIELDVLLIGVSFGPAAVPIFVTEQLRPFVPQLL
jgi:hypothetical protein